ncbi:MAG: glycosyltransferase family 2 protein, partial [Gammaproteobacteria bacterium]|nr:glycosyltransferase family 2 protein [Gammaproteobacteria bacterium]
MATTRAAIEWIIIDDGSDDNTADVVNAFIPSLTSTPIPLTLSLHRQTNVGLAETRNRGITYATGTYIWFVDADDLIIPEALPKLIAAIGTGADMLSFQAIRFGDAIEEAPIY